MKAFGHDFAKQKHGTIATGLPERSEGGPRGPERSEGYRREAATRMPKALGHDFAKQKHGTICEAKAWYNMQAGKRRRGSV